MPEDRSVQSSQSTVDLRALAQLVPLNSLSADNFKDLVQRVQIEQLSAGHSLFRRDDRDSWAYYLLEGELELRDANKVVSVLQGGMSAAQHPIAPQQPRQWQAVARTDISFVRIDTTLLDILLTWDQSAGYVVADLESEAPAEDADWMTRMLGSKVFYQVPPANIQEIFKRMEAVSMSAGEVVIRQGEVGDYYYVLRQGRAEVLRTAPNGATVRLAQLQQGACFGEEALMADCERNATVTMTSDGVLMRLSKADFDALLKAPLLHEVEYHAAESLVEQGACWLDVRLESEHYNGAILHSLNIPLYLLRLRLRELDPETTYILYCDTGRRSAAAAFLLSEAGFDVRVLSGGYLRAVPEAVAA
ncbi:MAG: cyclic nucleotide-binding domain-containing protein [Gammaproteobacteria bacterium]|nr:cyclic nucleotide-binding domain-containing protein [Gammaproteobacteria bacterium]MBU2478409.1 cyclic nucleotide-binding domain-containing protein [Gammaproteobacteria bacterium]